MLDCFLSLSHQDCQEGTEGKMPVFSILHLSESFFKVLKHARIYRPREDSKPENEIIKAAFKEGKQAVVSERDCK